MSEAKLPAPTAYRTRYRSEPGMIGHYPWTYMDQTRRRLPIPKEYEQEDLFTAADVLAAYQAGRDAALEEAAKVCDAKYALHRDKWGAGGDENDCGISTGAAECGDEIRKLKGPQP